MDRLFMVAVRGHLGLLLVSILNSRFFHQLPGLIPVHRKSLLVKGLLHPAVSIVIISRF